MIDRQVKVPLHYQMYLDLLQKIKRGEYECGDRIPSEPQLEKLYGVSRITVRRAVEMLAEEGIVQKNRGKKGTIVISAKHAYDAAKLTSFSDDVRLYGERPNSELVGFDEVIPSEKVASLLCSTEGEHVYRIERKRFRADAVVGVHRAYIRRLDGLTLFAEDFSSDTSLYVLLASRGVKPVSASEVLEVRTPAKDVLSMLDLPAGTAVFYKERTTYCSGHRPLEYVEMYYNPDFYRYRVELQLDVDA